MVTSKAPPAARPTTSPFARQVHHIPRGAAARAAIPAHTTAATATVHTRPHYTNAQRRTCTYQHSTGHCTCWQLFTSHHTTNLETCMVDFGDDAMSCQHHQHPTPPPPPPTTASHPRKAHHSSPGSLCCWSVLNMTRRSFFMSP